MRLSSAAGGLRASLRNLGRLATWVVGLLNSLSLKVEATSTYPVQWHERMRRFGTIESAAKNPAASFVNGPEVWLNSGVDNTAHMQ